MAYINLRDVIKRYGNHLAVDNISLSVHEGEVFGLLGPNGAGKSTSIKMISGLLSANSGEIEVAGMNVRNDPIAVKSMMGLVPQDIAVYGNFTAKENVEFFASLYGLRGTGLRKKVDEALDFVGLSHTGRQKAKTFSGGMKRRLNIACAIAHRPKIIVMDEPTVGIDPQSRNHILNSVKELNQQGTTVIYTSHYMEEVESVCDRVGIIDHGKLVACGTKSELREILSAEESIVIVAVDIRYNPIDEIRSLPGVISVTHVDNTITIDTRNVQDNLQDVLFILSKAEVKVRNISLREPNLESLFLELTGRSLRD